MAYAKPALAGVLFFIAATQFMLGLMIAEATYPGYSLSGNYISDLGVGPSSAIFNTSALLFGLLSLVGTYLLASAIDYRILMILLGLMSVGAIGVGLVTSEFTTVHGAVSLTAFWFGGLSAVFSSRVSRMPLSAIGVALGLMTLAALALFAAGLVTTNSLTSDAPPPTSPLFLGIGPGGMERMIVYPALLWLILFSGSLMSFPEGYESPEGPQG
jgi:hypothetical membrane protein